MGDKDKKCEICGIKSAKYKCALCRKDACPSCYWLQFGLCKTCSKK